MRRRLQQIRDGDVVRKGEFVVVLVCNPEKPGSAIDADRLLAALLEVMPGKQAAAIVAEATGEKTQYRLPANAGHEIRRIVLPGAPVWRRIRDPETPESPRQSL